MMAAVLESQRLAAWLCPYLRTDMGSLPTNYAFIYMWPALTIWKIFRAEPLGTAVYITR
jgi:hypothetical protein